MEHSKHSSRQEPSVPIRDSLPSSGESVDACFVVQIVGRILRVQGTQLGAVKRDTIALCADSGRQLGTAATGIGTSDGK
jgi:hypothetical protein